MNFKVYIAANPVKLKKKRMREHGMDEYAS